MLIFNTLIRKYPLDRAEADIQYSKYRHKDAAEWGEKREFKQLVRAAAADEGGSGG